MFGLSFWELAMILVVALLVLGPKRLPGLAKSVGKGLRELRKASSDLRSAIEEPLEEVRKPLEDLRNDLADTVHNIEEEVEREARLEDGADKQPNPYEEGGGAGEPTEVEDRRREVEEMYASAARAELGGEREEGEEEEGARAAQARAARANKPAREQDEREPDGPERAEQDEREPEKPAQAEPEDKKPAPPPAPKT